MIRRKAAADGFGASPTFRWRSHEISRIEGLSDAVFGFAITLLVVALEVPQTFDELLERGVHRQLPPSCPGLLLP